MDSKSVINVVAIQCPAEVEQKFNKWYNEVHIPMLLKSKRIKKATRYKRLTADEGYSNYLAIYEFDSPEAFEAHSTSPAIAAALAEMQQTWKEGGFDVKCRVQYQAIKTWQQG